MKVVWIVDRLIIKEYRGTNFYIYPVRKYCTFLQKKEKKKKNRVEESKYIYVS